VSAELDTVSALMAEYISQAGTGAVFGYPGTSNIEFMEGARRRGVNVVLARREATAAFMAEGYAMAGGGLGVCISTLGPGSTALLQGVAAANLDRVPLLAISGQIESSREPWFTHQVVDHNRMYAPVTKWAGRMEAAAASTIMRKAIRLATAERPGAVHLTTHSDVAKAAPGKGGVALPPLAPAAQAGEVVVTGADPQRVLRDARKPVLLVGGAAMRAGATGATTALAEAGHLPVVVAPMAKGVFPEDHPLFAGVLDMACNQVVWDLLAAADLVVAIGFDPVELIKPWLVDTPVLHVDAVPNIDQVYRSDVELVGHIPALVDFLAAAGPDSAWTDAEIERHRGRLRDTYYSGRVEGALNPTDVVDVLRASLPRDTLVTTDVGSHKLLVGQGWTTYEPRTSLMSNGLSSMGFSLPGAIGAKLACPRRPVLATVGDGGFAMLQGELRLASALSLGMVVVVFVDGSLNRIELKQQVLGYPSTATRIEETDLPALAASMDCDGERVSDALSLEKLIASAGELTRPLVVAAHIDPAQYAAQF
jgi:acetolactate synthase-1/2/3 large subunit